MRGPTVPAFVHRAERIRLGSVAKPKPVFALGIPTRRFKCPVRSNLCGLAVNQHLNAMPQFSCKANARWKASEPAISLQPDPSDKMRLNLMWWAKNVQNVIRITHCHRTCRSHVAKEKPIGRNTRRTVFVHLRGGATG